MKYKKLIGLSTFNIILNSAGTLLIKVSLLNEKNQALRRNLLKSKKN